MPCCSTRMSLASLKGAKTRGAIWAAQQSVKNQARLYGLSGLALLICLLLSACSLYTLRPLNAAGGGTASQTFDPETYVNQIWDSRVVPTVVQQAHDAGEVLAALKADQRAAQQRYGHQEGDGPYTFLVKGVGRVVSINTSSRSGTLGIDLPPYDGKADLFLQIGPVILGTAIRDGVGFIHFGQFVNQIQYAQVADALNARAVQVAQRIHPTGLQGKLLRFYGVFALTDPQTILVAPVKLDVEGSGS
jgi:predicted lipoprotein